MGEVLVGNTREFSSGDRKIISHGDKEIGVFFLDGTYYAYENLCKHQGGPVCEGEVLGKVEVILKPDRSDLEERFSDQEIHLVCPWHGFEWDVKTGECAVKRSLTLNRYEVVQRGEEVYVIC